MKQYLRAFLIVACAVLAVSATSAGAVTVHRPRAHLSHRQLMRLIVAARTPDDHERLAEYYLNEAHLLRREARRHRQFARTLDGGTSLDDSNFFNIGRTARHCRIVAEEYLKDAQRAATLARLHMQMARETTRRAN